MPAWDYSPAHWDRILQVKSNSPPLRIGKSDLIVSGPLIEGLRRSRPGGERSLGRRILDLLIIRLAVPRPLPSTPTGGKYFCWGESDRPWGAVSGKAVSPGASDNAMFREPACLLISIGK